GARGAPRRARRRSAARRAAPHLHLRRRPRRGRRGRERVPPDRDRADGRELPARRRRGERPRAPGGGARRRRRLWRGEPDRELARARCLRARARPGRVGVTPAAAARRVPVVLDGFISGAAALVAVTLAPDARHALFASHRSAEPGHAVILDHLGLTPYLDLALRLGEGTGAALFIHLARAAALIWREMATFKSAGVSQSEGASGR